MEVRVQHVNGGRVHHSTLIQLSIQLNHNSVLINNKHEAGDTKKRCRYHFVGVMGGRESD